MRSRIFIATIIVGLAIAAFVAVIIFFIPESWQNGKFASLVIAASGVIAAVVCIIILSVINAGQVAGQQSHYVAIIGMPGSGKTSLIITLFQEIFAGKIASVKATPRGDSTIMRVDEEIMRKETGLAPAKTTDQTMFSYRMDIENKGLMNRIYRMELGDYPGEFSEQLSEKIYYESIRKTEYFEWCMRADAYIFIIDVSRYLLARDRKAFVAESSRTIRESWHLILDSKYKTAVSLSKKPVLVIFTKMDVADLIELDKEGRKTGSIRDEEIKKKASSEQGNHTHEIQLDKYRFLQSELNGRYIDLFNFLKPQSKFFSVLYCSSLGKINNRFAEVQKMLKLLLPASFR